jgi:hypothetical protein
MEDQEDFRLHQEAAAAGEIHHRPFQGWVDQEGYLNRSLDQVGPVVEQREKLR